MEGSDHLITILLNVYAARNVPKSDPTGLSDPYCIISYTSIDKKGAKKKKEKTGTKKENLNPVWDKVYTLKNVISESYISFDVFDWNNVLKFSADDFLGKFVLPVEKIPLKQRKVWNVPLLENGKAAGQLFFVTYAISSVDYKKEDESKYTKEVLQQDQIMKVPMYIKPHYSRLQVEVVKTDGLIPAKEKGNVFAQITLGKQTLETDVYKGKGDCKFANVFEFSYKSANTLNIAFKDWKLIQNGTVLGSVSIDLTKIPLNEPVEKVEMIKGAKGKATIKILKTELQGLETTLPVECADDDDDEWCKQNLPSMEMFLDECTAKGIVPPKCKEGYHFEMETKDITKLVNDSTPVFNDKYFEKPVTDVIMPTEGKRVFFNEINSDKRPIILCIAGGKDSMKKAVIHTQFGFTKTYITDDKDIDNEVINILGMKATDVKMREIKDQAIWKQIEGYETRRKCPSYKIGLIYAKANQHAEQEFLSNSAGSEEFKEFCDIIGQTVPLKGYTGYRGGLDVQNDTTGINSVVSELNKTQIMFHVSTMLQHVESDPQHLDKKRHIGNDVVVVIFKEVDAKKEDEVDLESFITQFNHVFIIVTPVEIKGSKLYRVCVCCKSAVQAFLPRFPEEQYFKRDESFKQWLLTKAINGERAALESPQFIKSQREAQGGLLKNILDGVDQSGFLKGIINTLV